MSVRLGASKGKSFNDRVLAGEVRTLALKEIKRILVSKDDRLKDYKQQVILRLAGSILPKLNEHTGEDGGDILLKWQDS